MSGDQCSTDVHKHATYRASGTAGRNKDAPDAAEAAHDARAFGPDPTFDPVTSRFNETAAT